VKIFYTLFSKKVKNRPHHLININKTYLMAKTSTSVLVKEKPKKVRKGVHAKTKSSKNKGSQNYKKTYKGQGK
jgi:hypothetical protein